MSPGTRAGGPGTTGCLVYHGLRRDLAAFSEAVPATPVEDRQAWAALERRWDVLATVLRHHPGGWAQDADLRRSLGACGPAFARLRGHPDPGARAALSVRLAAAREGLARHPPDEHGGGPVPARPSRDLVPWVLAGVPPGAQEDLLVAGGPRFRLRWWLTRGRFARLEARAFAHRR